MQRTNGELELLGPVTLLYEFWRDSNNRPYLCADASKAVKGNSILAYTHPQFSRLMQCAARGDPDEGFPNQVGLDSCGGACVDTKSDNSNCGSCGVLCQIAHAQNFGCQSSACAYQCDAGYIDCHNNRCARLADDPLNCGACGHVCPGAASGTATCIAGQCRCITAPTGLDSDGDCIADAADRCPCDPDEVNPFDSVHNDGDGVCGQCVSTNSDTAGRCRGTCRPSIPTDNCL